MLVRGYTVRASMEVKARRRRPLARFHLGHVILRQLFQRKLRFAPLRSAGVKQSYLNPIRHELGKYQ